MKKFELIPQPVSSVDIDWNLPTMAQSIFKDHLKLMGNKEEELVKQALIEIGYDEAIKSLSTRFPKIAIVKYEAWKYYFVDNGTPTGLFVIAISEWKSTMRNDDPTVYGVSAYFKFDYHKNLELVPGDVQFTIR